MSELVVPTVFILAILLYLYFSRAKKYDTMLRIAELGEKVDEKLIFALQKEQGSFKNDYRSSLIWLAAGIPVGIAIWGSSDGSERVLGFIPVFIAIAYYVSGRLRLRGDDS